MHDLLTGIIRPRLALSSLFFHLALHAREQIDRARGIMADPAIVDVLDGKRVNVIPALASLALYDDEIRFLEHAQVLHDCASVQAAKVAAEISRRSRLIFQQIKNFSSFVIGQRLEDPFLFVGFLVARC